MPIKTLAVRGAPAIGAAGAAAVALWAVNEGARGAVLHGCSEAGESFLAELRPVAAEISAARPTAVNLMWATARMESFAKHLVAEGAAPGEVADSLFDEVLAIEREDEKVNRATGAAGAALIPEHARILTHCNAGSLATVFFGTAPRRCVCRRRAGQGRAASSPMRRVRWARVRDSRAGSFPVRACL